jgi:hypothetical protein
MERSPRFPAETSSAGSPEKSAPKRELRIPIARVETAPSSPESQPRPPAPSVQEVLQMTEQPQAEQSTDKKKRSKKKSTSAMPKGESAKVEAQADVEPATSKPEVAAAETKDSDHGAEHDEASQELTGKRAGSKKETEPYEQLPIQEVPLDAISGGEVVIDLAALRHDHAQTPEYELPLQTEAVGVATTAEDDSRTPAELAAESEPDQAEPSNEAAVNTPRPELLFSHEQPVEAEPTLANLAGGSGEPPNIPPVPPEIRGGAAGFPEPERYPQSPVMPSETQQASYIPPARGTGRRNYGAGLISGTSRVVNAAAERFVTKREMQQAVDEAERAGTGRGLLGGLLIGGLYEHFKHKRREKRQEKKYQQLTKKLDKTQTENRFAVNEQIRKQDITEHRLRTTERRLAEANRTNKEALLKSAQTEQLQEKKTPVVDNPEQGFKVPEGQRLVKEGAFLAQIDKKTGKVVEKPSFEYGHEYYRERAHEGMPAAQRTMAAGEVALAAAAMSQSGKKPSSDASSTSGGANGSAWSAPTIPNATTQGPPPRTKGASAPTLSNNDTPEKPLWPWVVALVVIVICLVALLR